MNDHRHAQPRLSDPRFRGAAPTMGVASQVAGYMRLAVAGMAPMYLGPEHTFAHTLRGVPHPRGPRLEPQGASLRYTSIAALGLALCSDAAQRAVLQGDTAAELARWTADRATSDPDPGAVALAVWAVAEAAGEADDGLIRRLLDLLESGSPLPTVDVAWMLSGATAVHTLPGETDREDLAIIVRKARRRLLRSQGEAGIFPHALPAGSLGRWREHVACFADQVYPIQALARHAAVTGHADALAAANRCADRICALQGPNGQWWWHYDVRDGSVVEGFPVYSVHQHAMAPMALLDLLDSGGHDHTAAVALGLEWLETHPEVFGSLVDEENAVIWRKVGRREPLKAARKAAAVTTSLKPGWHLPGTDALMPPTVIDRECRPYELGWLLYAWRSRVPVIPMTDPQALVDRFSAGVAGSDRPKQRLYGMPMDAVTLHQVVDACAAAIDRRQQLQIGVLNAAKIVQMRTDHRLQESLSECELLLADGQSVVWASRLLGHPLPERVAGIDIFEALLTLAHERSHGVYLLGATPEVLARLEENLTRRFPGLQLAGRRDGYFSDEEAPTVAEEIRSSGADMLFLGMTSPKKENFIGQYGAGLGVPVIHGVGGSFDVLAGVTKRAPEAWQKAGMEWAYRLKQEPRRLARRYLTTNSAFVAVTLRERFHEPLP